MQPLYTCSSCGFLSTRITAYRRIQGVRFCEQCAVAYMAGREPVATWVAEALRSIAPTSRAVLDAEKETGHG